MSRRTHATALALLTLASLSACSKSSEPEASPTATAPAASSATPAPAAGAIQLGQSVAFIRTDTGAKVGDIRFIAIQTLPAECVVSTRPGVTLAIQVAISNGPGEQLPVPDTYQLLYSDGAESHRAVETASIYGCESAYPAVATAPPGGQAQGWFAVRVAAVPEQLVYTPVVGDQTSTAGNIKLLSVAPATVSVSVPAQPAAVPGPAPSTSPAPDSPVPSTVVAPPMTTAPVTAVAPPTGRDSEGRPNGTGGKLVGCADESIYQPGTGVYEDGSRGFAPECLPGGALR